ncbi:MAG: alpha/beta fold hydrolase [Planctomycetota bacterium]|nr:alpha/beta fold hydrolase [Planctomycetota bacterium]
MTTRTQAAADVAPVLEAEPSSEGLLTWWLYTPVRKEVLETAKPPLGAREGEAVPGTTGKWAVHIGAGRFVDFRQLLTGSSGALWASARIDSQSGGMRRLRGGTYCALRVYVDGKLVLDKPQPLAPYLDEVEAQIELPKGLCEVSVGVSIRQGYCGFQLSLSEGRDRGGQPRKVAGDRILVPTATGQTPDITAVAMRAISFGSTETFVTPGDKVTLVAGLMGSIPAGLAPLSGRFLGPDGKVIGAELPVRPAAALVGRALWQASYAVPAEMGVAHALTLEVKAGEKALGVRKIELYSLRGLSAAAQTLEGEIQQRAARAKRALPHAALAAERLRLFVTKIEAGEERITNELGTRLLELLANARRFADAEEQGRDPLEGATGYLERAYISRIDGGTQPYHVQVPTAYAAAKGGAEKYPLVIFLHGYVPSYDKHRWWDEMTEFNVHFERNNAFLAIPFGRSNADFQSCGEVDVLDVIAEVRRLYPIDAGRIYLYGYSMGGMAVYHLAAHYPDLFAAAIVMAGRADSPLQNKQPLEKFHPYKQWLIHADNPISLCEDFLNIPLRIYHGKNDPIISLDEARRMEARLKELGCDATLTAMPGDHFFGFDLMTTEEPLKWLLSQKRAAAPAKGRLKAYNLKYAREGPLAVTAVTGELKPVEAEWTVKDGGGGVEVTRISDNVLEYSVNGKLAKQADGKGLRKTPRCAGPVREAICGPFLLVYGTSGAAEGNARNKRNAEQFAQEWFGFTRSHAVLKADKDVTDEEKQGKNLFLFGEEQENLLHAAAAKGLPFAVKDSVVTIGDRKVAIAELPPKTVKEPLQEDDGKAPNAPPTPRGTGFMYIYPSPFAPADSGRVIVVCAGIPYGREVGINHKLDLVPDFILYDDQVDQDLTSTNRFICAGFFNGEWKLDPKLMWWAEK